MEKEITLSKQQAQQITLASFGLLTPPRHKASKDDLLTSIRQIHNLQIDTISVVARAHMHILWSRLGSYPVNWLEELHAEGKLFEYFAHAVCLMPIEDYPLFRALMLHRFVGWGNIRDWGRENAATVDEILTHIQQNGAVKSSDFKSDQTRGAWWDWKKEKVALEYLYYRGDLMIARRESFQRVYDLRERVLPGWDDTQAPEYPVSVRELTRKAIKALGIANITWAASYFYLKKAETAEAIEQLKVEGALIPVSIKGVKGGPFFALTESAPLLEDALANRLKANHTTILSPFDPLISDRNRTRELFDFDYTIECYTPAPRRKYGYFVLPILHKGQIVGRLDAKAWRKEGRLQVIALYLEPGTKISSGLTTALAKSLHAYANWQGLTTIMIDRIEPEAFRSELVSHLENG